MPWHYTTPLDLIDHWQTLIAGLVALAAAIITVSVTLTVEQRKVDRELDALRKSLAIEVRQLIPRALAAHTSLKTLGAKTDGPITARMVESLSGLRAPIVYNANAFQIGLLEADAMDVVIVYGLLETARESVRLMGTSRTPDDINPAIVLQAAGIFLEACKYARTVLPKMRTGVASHDDRDADLIQAISAATVPISAV
ncbi:MAG TPA: hypothetical protein VII73_02975 [Caulobacteraceae bacterium]